MENIGIAILVSGLIPFAVYYATVQIKNGYVGAPYFIGHKVFFILGTYQTHKFVEAWEERVAIEENLDEINGLADNVIDLEMAEKLKIMYIIRRICWMLGFVLVYGIVITILSASDIKSIKDCRILQTGVLAYHHYAIMDIQEDDKTWIN